MATTENDSGADKPGWPFGANGGANQRRRVAGEHQQTFGFLYRKTSEAHKINASNGAKIPRSERRSGCTGLVK